MPQDAGVEEEEEEENGSGSGGRIIDNRLVPFYFL